MKGKFVLGLFLSFWLGISSNINNPSKDISLTTRDKSSLSGQRAMLACFSESDILNVLQNMKSASEVVKTRQTRERLLSQANKDPICREELIAGVMRAMDRPNSNMGDLEMFYVWREGADLLGELKAAEALDLLISHLRLKNDVLFSTTMSHQPALRSVIKIGGIAIPKLSEVLLHSPDQQMRRDAVYCISAIGGQDALRVLQQSLPSETDPCVNKFIRVSVECLDNDDYTKKWADNARWYSAFMCNE